MSAQPLAVHDLPLFDLADVMRARFGPGLARLARQAGMERQELPGEAILITDEALVGFDPARGDFGGRWWHTCQRRFARLGGAALGGGLEVDQAGGDDPIDILLAREAIGRLAATGLVAAAMRDDRGSSSRTQRRHRARLGGAARAYGCGPQCELPLGGLAW